MGLDGGGAGSSTCKSGLLSPLTALRQEKERKKEKKSTCKQNHISWSRFVCCPHHPPHPDCQKTCRTSTAGAPSSRHTSSILLRSGRSGLKLHQGMRTNSGCLLWEGRLMWTFCTLQRWTVPAVRSWAPRKLGAPRKRRLPCGQCVNYRWPLISLPQFSEVNSHFSSSDIWTVTLLLATDVSRIHSNRLHVVWHMCAKSNCLHDNYLHVARSSNLHWSSRKLSHSF